jgi:hypothetical protein
VNGDEREEVRDAPVDGNGDEDRDDEDDGDDDDDGKNEEARLFAE